MSRKIDAPVPKQKSRDSAVLLGVLGAALLVSPFGRGVVGEEAVFVCRTLVFAAAAWLALSFPFRGRDALPARRPFLLISALLGACLLGAVAAPYKFGALDRLVDVASGASILLLVLGARVLEPRSRDRALALVVASAACHGTLFGVAVFGRFSGLSRLYTPDKGVLGAYFATAAVAALFVAVRPGQAARRSLWYSAAVVPLAAGVIATGSRTGIAALLPGVVLALGHRPRLLLVSALAFAMFVVAVPNPIRARIADIRQDAYAWERITIFRGGARMFLDHPAAGVGLGQFASFFPRYALPLDSGHAAARYGKRTWHAHNELLQAAAELGVMGLAPALWAAAWVALRAIRGARSALGPASAATAGLFTLGAAAMVSTCLDHPMGVVLASVLGGTACAAREPSAAREPARHAAAGTMRNSLAWALAAAAFAGAVFLPYAADRGRRGAARAVAAGDLNRALEAAGRSERLCPYSAEYPAFQGELIAKHLGRSPDLHAYPLVLSFLERATALNPNEGRYRRALAELHRVYFDGFSPALELFEASDQAYASAMALWPRHAPLIFDRATLNLAGGRDDRGETMLREALAIEPRFVAARVYLEAFLRVRGRTAEADIEARALAAVRAWARDYSAMGEFERELLAEPGPVGPVSNPHPKRQEED